MKLEVSKQWLESVTLEEDAEDCSAGILSLSDLIHFAEPDPIDVLSGEHKEVKRNVPRHRASRKSPLAAPTKPA